MDKETLLEQIRLAEEHVAIGKRNVERQRELIDSLDRGGHPTDEAWRLLHLFEATLGLHLGDRDRLRQRLALMNGR